MTYLIQKEIQTRNGETRKLDVDVTVGDREQALWMFNENLNWRLDFLGRFILSQKKKVRMNNKLRIMTEQHESVSATLSSTLYNWAQAQKEAETSRAENARVTGSIEKMLAGWDTYQNNLRATMTSLNSEMAKITQYNIAIKTDYEGLTKFVAGLKVDQFTVECQEVVVQYGKLVESLEKIAIVIRELNQQIITLQAEISSWEAQIEGYELKWMTGKDNLFKKAQDKLYVLFSTKFGLDHDKATEAQLLDMLKKHDGMGAYEEIQAFFKVAYEQFSEFKNHKAEFCSMGALEDLSKVGKIIIELGEFCNV